VDIVEADHAFLAAEVWWKMAAAAAVRLRSQARARMRPPASSNVGVKANARADADKREALPGRLAVYAYEQAAPVRRRKCAR